MLDFSKIKEYIEIYKDNIRNGVLPERKKDNRRDYLKALDAAAVALEIVTPRNPREELPKKIGFYLTRIDGHFFEYYWTGSIFSDLTWNDDTSSIEFDEVIPFDDIEYWYHLPLVERVVRATL